MIYPKLLITLTVSVLTIHSPIDRCSEFDLVDPNCTLLFR